MCDRGSVDDPPSPIRSINAVTLAVSDMARSHRFYTRLGFEVRYGGPGASFTSFHVGSGFLNLQLVPDRSREREVWGRVIFWVDDVDAVHATALDSGMVPEMSPSDAPWGERYFHLRDPDGHELSFARLLTP